MIFNSLQFIIFFIIVVAAYFALPHRFRWILLLLASYYFYMSWKPEYGFLLLATTIVDYAVAIAISRSKNVTKRKWLLAVSLISNLGVLFLFKYWGLTSESLQAVFQVIGLSVHVPYYHLLLPVGISFYVFQSLSYTIDVYRGAQKAETHFGLFALYVSFFPQLVAGPIERSTHLLPQFTQIHTFEYTRLIDGLKRIAWGLFKKIVIADRLAEFVNVVYNNPSEHGGLSILIATYFFAFQIYCDFSGYSDIAIGTAKIMGFDFRENFERPYFAQSIADFWRRWHISLTTWFKDYIYIPLGGNRKGIGRQYVNIFVIFFISGVWHGANWTFIVWGILHGLYSIIGRATLAARNALVQGLHIPLRVVIWWRLFATFHLVCFAWVLFRTNNLHDLWVMVQRFISGVGVNEFITAAAHSSVLLGAVWIIVLLFFEFLQEKKIAPTVFIRQPIAVRFAGYVVLLMIILLFGKFGGSDFIYFQF